MIRRSPLETSPNRLAKRKASTFTMQSLRRAARVVAPSLIALTFATAAHAQGTMDFSGATTLMGTFNYRNDYAGIEQWSRFITNDHYAYHTQLHRQHEEFAKLWDKNLQQQGFAEAFERQHTPRA